jgi:hypothetical protein
MDNLTRVGGTVIYTDGYRRDHDALVTAVWGPNCINVVFTSGDSAKEDPYGRQIERETSVSRYDAVSNNFGRCFRDVGVDAVFVERPQSK